MAVRHAAIRSLECAARPERLGWSYWSPARLLAVGVVTVEKHGRHRYVRLAPPAVAQMMEGIMQVAYGAETCRTPIAVGPRDAALRAARTCYGHLAGRLGVALADAMVMGGSAALTRCSNETYENIALPDVSKATGQVLELPLTSC